jgi:DNA polymerase-3 subunit epsilon
MEMGRCGAPCLAGSGESVDDYARHVLAYRDLVEGRPSDVVAHLRSRLDVLAAAERFEDAGFQRDRLTALVRSVSRWQDVTALTGVAELVAARPTDDLGWELVVVRHGRLAAAGVLARGAAAAPFVDAMVATAETVLPGPGPLPASTAEEVHCLLRWLESDGVRLVRLDGTLASPAYGSGRLRSWLGEVGAGRDSVRPFDDRRGLRPSARPARATA